VAFPRCSACFGSQKNDAHVGIVGADFAHWCIRGLLGRDEAFLSQLWKIPQEMVCKV
jgi:hypothetical protein